MRLRRPTALAAVMLKEIRQTARDKRVIAVLLVAPVIQLIVLGYAVNLDVNHVPTVVADEDRTAESRALVAGLVAGDTFDLTTQVERASDAMAEVAAGRAAVAVVVPRGFARERAAGRPVQLQGLTDGADSNRAIVSQNALMAYATQQALRDVAARIQQLSAARGVATGLGATTVEPRVLYNPTLTSSHYFVPGVAATLLLIVSIIVTAMGLAREKEVGTLEQVLVTPIQPLTLVLGKTIPYGVIGLMDLALVVAAAMVLFDVPLRGDLPTLFTGGALYLLSVLGIGLFVSALARTQQQAFMVAMLFVMPAILLSGFITPVANMPEWLQPLTAFNPVRHFVEVMRAVMLKGSSFEDLLPQLAALAGMGLSIFGLAVVTLSRRLT
ncbi:MAG: ABC transporter permease [Deltaproteobacteria bacterium]|nr:MAG: ABC transporter permease [Deltaproteobacteria bacterium]